MRTLGLLFIALFSLPLLAGPLTVGGILPAEDNNFALKFSLKDGGSLTLLANADEKKENGVRLTFTRNDKALSVKLSSGQLATAETDDVSKDFGKVAADAPFSLQIDVHGHGHVIVDGATGESLEYASWKTNGRHWTVDVRKGKLTKAIVGKVKHAER